MSLIFKYSIKAIPPSNNKFIGKNQRWQYQNEKKKWARLIHRLIDADAFLKWLKEFHPNDVAIMSGIKNARTIVEAEVSE